MIRVSLMPLTTALGLALLTVACGDDAAEESASSSTGTLAGPTSGAGAGASTGAGAGGPGSGGSGGAGAGGGNTSVGTGGAGGGGGDGTCSQPEDGQWGAPGETFTLPAPAEEGGAIYYPDLQASFPDVDWETLDRLYVPAGHWRSLLLGNLPQRSLVEPLVITNQGGQVKIGGLGANYNVVLSGGSGWIFTGRHDPVSGTGDAGFPGHRGCDYGATRGTYGIFVDGAFDGAPHGIAVGGRATEFELDFAEVTRVSFAGIVLKTDDVGDATMRDVAVHDLYVHDTASEGMYIGSTQAVPQHAFERLRLYNNRVLRTGTESFQIGQLGEGCEIHHNVFAMGALDWKDPFSQYQDGGVQLGFRYGSSSFHHNVVIGAAGTMIAFFPQPREGDPHAEGDVVRMHDNYFSSTRNLGGYLFPDHDGVTAYEWERNVFRDLVYSYDEIDEGAAPPGSVLLTFNESAPFSFLDNTWEGDLDFLNRLPTGEGTSENFTGSGNTNATVPPVSFVDFMGWPEGTEVFRLEEWAATSGPLGGAPVVYEPGDFVMFDGDLYECVADAPHSGLVPPENPDTWALRAPPTDDVRLAPGSAHASVGLLDAP